MDSAAQALRWAREEFGEAELGDRRRNDRLVQIARRAAERPAGRVSEVIESAAERQGAYDFLESAYASHEAIVAAMGRATALRSVPERYVVVAVDQCSLSLLDKAQDPERRKDFGLVGSVTDGIRGVHVVNALALTPHGLPLGLAAQRYWSRSLTPHGRSRRERELAKLEDTELGHWAWVLGRVHEQYAQHAPEVVPWFQLDRAGDAWRLMRFLDQGGLAFTIRSRANRCVLDASGRTCRVLDLLRKSKLQGVLHLSVSAGPKRQARVARLHVRAVPVTLRLRNPGFSGAPGLIQSRSDRRSMRRRLGGSMAARS